MNRIFKPGSVIVSDYTDFHGNKSKGLFYVIYNEALDSNVNYKGNLLCLKVTSNPTFIDNYSYSLPSGQFKKLSSDSFVMCSKPVLICTNEETHCLFEIYGNAYKGIYKVFQKFLKDVNRQMLDYL